MFEHLRGLLSGVLTFYAWTIGLGLLALMVTTLAQGAIDLVRDWTGHALRNARTDDYRRGT
jgi:hypothetical protein